jgi:hypothetical protein
VNRVPQSQKTPIRIDVTGGIAGESDAHSIAAEVYLSLDDAQRLAELLSAAVKAKP